VKRPRVSIAGLMFAVAAGALNFCVMRSAVLDAHRNFAFGILPMASLLTLVALHSAPNLRHGGCLSPFAVGFEASGWVAVFAFVTCSSIAASEVSAYTELILDPVFPIIRPCLEAAPGSVAMFGYLGLFTIIYSLPQLLLALLGGWLGRKAGLTARFEWRGNAEVAPDPTRSVPASTSTAP
jgi:hypothetical protein